MTALNVLLVGNNEVGSGINSDLVMISYCGTDSPNCTGLVSLFIFSVTYATVVASAGTAGIACHCRME